MQGGAPLSDLSILAGVPLPHATSTYTPIPHKDVIDTLLQGAAALQLRVTDVEYSLMRGGRQLFFSIIFEGSTSKEYEWSLVGINSYDKSLALRLGGGLITSVCTNLSLSAEYYYYHKHTPGVSLRDATQRVLGHLPTECKILEDFMDSMKQAITIAQGAYFILQWGKEVSIRKQDIYSIIDLWQEPEHKAFVPYNTQVYGLYQAVTTVCGKWSASRQYPALNHLHAKMEEWEWD